MQGDVGCQGFQPRAQSCACGAEWEESGECIICLLTLGGCIIGRQVLPGQ